MPISVKCTDCGKALKAPDAMAGNKAKCPDCGAIVPIPKAVMDAEEIGDEPPVKRKPKAKPTDDEYDSTLDDLADYEAEAPTDESAKRKACPMCGEQIAKTAVKCRFCGEILDPSVRKRQRSKTSSVANDELTGVDIALCILCGGIGCIVGIVALIRGQSSRGGKMIGISLLAGFAWRAIGFVISEMAKN